MDTKTLNLMRTVLLVTVILLLALTVFAYFRRGEFDFFTIVVAMICLFLYVVTKKKTS